LSLPMHTEMNYEMVQFICQIFNDVIKDITATN
jgi:hypothetical protein